MELEAWAKKCLTCTHCYKRQDDDDILYCRCRKGKCNYKKYEEKEHSNMQTYARKSRKEQFKNMR